MRSRRVFLLPSYITYPRSRPPFPAPRVLQIGYQFQSYMFSLDSILSLGLFTASVVALVVHKFLIITLHGPLPIVGLLAAGPFLFVFDLITLLFLHQGLASTIRALRLFSSFVALFIMSCSATFVSYYQQANAEVQWGRSVEMIVEWRFFGKLLAQGNGSFGKVFLIYCLVGVAAIFTRLLFARSIREIDIELAISREKLELNKEPQYRYAAPFTLFTILLLIGSMFLPRHPWRHLTSTLLYDVVGTVSSIILAKNLQHLGGINGSSNGPATVIGANPLWDMNYNPADDPLYISNLDLAMDPFIASALEGTKFNNIVHIVLESMRSDSFPYQEDGQLDRYIKQNLELAEGGTPITKETISPFISSLATNILSWDTMWSTIPYTHKAMLGHYCGMLAVPEDWFVEIDEPARLYQHCLPKVFRHVNSVTDTGAEIFALLNGSRPETTDHWETAHFQSMTGRYEDEAGLLRTAGFSTVITAEELADLNGYQEHPSTYGYFDEESLEHLWKYVDHTRARVPKNKMYLSWMDSTSHTPFIFPPEWAEKNHRDYIQNEDSWAPINEWLNSVRWTDDIIKQIILGFRERGLEEETLFLIHGDHGFPFIGQYRTPIDNPHNEPYRIPMLIYNPLIRNPLKKTIQGSFYSLSIPTTILDLMISTKSFAQKAQRDLAERFAANYEHAQSLLRPIKETIRFFLVSPGKSQWVLENGRNLRCKFSLDGDDLVRLVDYIKDPNEVDGMDSWYGVEGLISDGAEEKFGPGTEVFLREAYERQLYMKDEIRRRYGVPS